MSDDPVRCPGYTCDLGRTQEWIAEPRGELDGKWSDLPPGHFWFSDGSYLAHKNTNASGGNA